MFTPEIFKNTWAQDIFPLVLYDPDQVQKLDLDEMTTAFLVQSGLPDSAAPYLNFVGTEKGGLKPLYPTYSSNIKHDQYYYIGFDGCGDYICIKGHEKCVVIVFHEDENNECSLNSSVPQLAESILLYSQFIDKIKKANGRRAYLEGNASPELLGWVTARLRDVDPLSFENNTFWSEELKRYMNEIPK